MRRNVKYVTIPIHIWTHPDLTVTERVVLMDIDSYCDMNGGTTVGVQLLSSSIGLPVKAIKETLKSLELKGAIQIKIDENGQKSIYPLLWKARYVADPGNVTLGDSPKDVETIDYDFIQEQWNSICSDLPKIEKYTPRRKQKTRTAIKGAGIDVPTLIKAFRLVATSAFLSGHKSEWAATFDWVIKSPDIITKILEGNYHKDYRERQDWEHILKGGGLKRDEPDDYYR